MQAFVVRFLRTKVADPDAAHNTHPQQVFSYTLFHFCEFPCIFEACAWEAEAEVEAAVVESRPKHLASHQP